MRDAASEAEALKCWNLRCAVYYVVIRSHYSHIDSWSHQTRVVLEAGMCSRMLSREVCVHIASEAWRLDPHGVTPEFQVLDKFSMFNLFNREKPFFVFCIILISG